MRHLVIGFCLSPSDHFKVLLSDEYIFLLFIMEHYDFFLGATTGIHNH